MSEIQTQSLEKFSQLLAESSSNDTVDQLLIYTRLRNSFSPQEIIELLFQYVRQTDSPENGLRVDETQRILKSAEKELPFDEARSRDLLIKELSPFYDKIGDIALHLSIGFATLEVIGFGVRNIDLGSELANQIRSLIFDHVGNSQNSFWALGLFVILSLGEKVISKFDISVPNILALKNIIEVVVDIGKILLPFILISVMVGYQIDAETFQRLPGVFGTPDMGDIPVGLISVIGLAKTFEMQRYHRPFFMPIVDKISKIQSRMKKLAPMIVLANINLLVMPKYLSMIVSIDGMNEKEPLSNSPVSLIRSLSKRDTFDG